MGFRNGPPNEAQDFKSPVSTDSTTAAAGNYDSIFLLDRQACIHPAAGRKPETIQEFLHDFALSRGQNADAML